MARYSDESKQGLTIALVLFVLLSLVLGLMAYFGYAEQDKLAKDNVELKGTLNREKIERDEYKMLYSMLLVATGVGNAKDTKDAFIDIQGNKNKADKDARGKALRDVYKDELDKLTKKGVKWGEVDEKPETSFSEHIAKLEKEAQAATKLNIDKDAFIKKATEDHQKELTALRDAKNRAEVAMAGAKDFMEKELKGIDGNYKEVIKKFEENIISAEEFAKKLAKVQKEKEELEAKLTAALKDAELKVKKLEEKIPQIDLLAYDKPKGRVTRIDINNQTAYINLGSADLARPGLTFSIFGVGQYRANAERKGSLEVINVIADHLSSVRITEVKAPARDPILSGDELYNPAWSPGLREHVAVAGMIDLTGDGRDGTLDFVKNLEKQGVAVDAYLDTRDVAVKGKGMNRQTGYLVMGEIPEFAVQEKIREGDARQERKMGINAEITKMRDDAIRLGVTVVPARRFMALMGFKMPRVPAKADDWNSYTIRQSGLGAKEEGGAMKMQGKDMPAKEKMEKKEEK